MLQKQFFILLLFTGLLSCSSNIKQVYKDDKGKFEIEFRSTPAIRTENEKFPFADITWTIASVDQPDGNNLSYLVKYADFPAEIISSDSVRILQDFFFFLQKEAVGSKGLITLDNLNIKQVQQYPGREFRWLENENKLGYTRRLFLVKNRLYYLEVRYPLTKDFNKDIEHFLDQFRLLQTEDNQYPEVVSEKPDKQFELIFPGKSQVRENPVFSELFGNFYSVSETYEVPGEQVNLPHVKNLMYGVNYGKLPEDKLNSTSAIKQFLTKTFTDIATSHQGEILSQREINLAGNWGLEGQVTILNNMAVMQVRAFIVNNYYYQVMVISKYGEQGNRDALDFLNSFRLKH